MTIVVNYRFEGLNNITRRQFLQGQGGSMRTEIAGSINRMGDAMVTHLAYDIGLNLNMSVEAVRNEVKIQRASRGRLEYVIDAQSLAARVSSPGSGRRLPYVPGQKTFGAPAQPERFLRSGQQVRIRTQNDENVCPICAKLAEGTYPVEEARSLLPAHPNCRCSIVTLDSAQPGPSQPGPNPGQPFPQRPGPAVGIDNRITRRQFLKGDWQPTMTTPSGARPGRGNANSGQMDMDDYLRHLTYDIRAAMERVVLKVT